MRSACWHFCEKIDSVRARCTLCLATVVHDGNTTNLNRHLNENHRRPYLAYKNSLELIKTNCKNFPKSTRRRRDARSRALYAAYLTLGHQSTCYLLICLGSFFLFVAVKRNTFTRRFFAAILICTPVKLSIKRLSAWLGGVN